MFGPSHPVRYFISYNGRKLVRGVQNYIRASDFARAYSETRLPVKLHYDASPIFRNLPGVRHELFVNKITNLRLALMHLNGIVIEPGKTFSFWERIGRPSEDKGYLPGLVIERGEPREGIGGGLCQLANIIHWLALHSPLVVVERHRHSFDIFPDDDRTVPFGTGATVVYNYKDLRLYNPSEKSFQFVFELDDKKLYAELYVSSALEETYKVTEREHEFVEIDNILYRKNVIYKEITDLSANITKEYRVLQNHCRCCYGRAEVSL